MRLSIKIFFLSLIVSLKIEGQSFSPFVYQVQYVDQLNSILIFNDSVYLTIGSKNPKEGQIKRLVKLDKQFKKGTIIKTLNSSSIISLEKTESKLIPVGMAQDLKNSSNALFLSINNNSVLAGPYLVGDTSNYIENSILQGNNIYILSQYNGYPIPFHSINSFGLIGKYNLDGNKVWEKYYRSDWSGFKISWFTNGFGINENKLLLLGLSHFDSAGRFRQRRIITAIINSNGNMLKANSDLDSLFMESTSTASEIAKRPLLPELVNPEAVQVNDSVIASYYYDLRGIAPPFWVFFKDDGSVLNIRKAWLFRDTLANPITINSKYFKGLIKKKNGSGFFALAIYGDSGYRLIELDDEMYVKKEIPVYNPFGSNSLFSVLEAFTEDEDGSLYTLSALFIDSIDPTDFYGAMVCKFDSNGTLLSNGPLFPVWSTC